MVFLSSVQAGLSSSLLLSLSHLGASAHRGQRYAAQPGARLSPASEQLALPHAGLPRLALLELEDLPTSPGAWIFLSGSPRKTSLGFSQQVGLRIGPRVQKQKLPGLLTDSGEKELPGQATLKRTVCTGRKPQDVWGIGATTARVRPYCLRAPCLHTSQAGQLGSESITASQTCKNGFGCI